MASDSLCSYNSIRKSFLLSRFWPEMAPVPIDLTITGIREQLRDKSVR